MKRLISFLLFCLPFFSAPAQSLLWEVSGNGLAKPSYVFGTIHMICKEDYLMTEVIRQKFNQADSVFLELDMDDPRLQMELMNYMQLEKGQSLRQIFGEEGYTRLDSFFRVRLNMSVSLFNGFKPFFVLSMLYQKILGCDVQESYELDFVKMAKAAKKDIRGLETVADQMAVFDSIPDTEEAAAILRMIDGFAEQQQQMQQLVKRYLQQDVEGLVQMTLESPDIMNAGERLLKNRNQNWIPRMETSMRTGSSFFAVGAAHLGGTYGVLALLRQAGYTVKPVSIR
ncbi:MAG TPA: TraB/GumN family protein [Lacibacter sp.]|nr:TraB/GumN family protein [Lacibacter sp.]HMO88310.1 TraB/GumN family protein [Lacibacter sp.]HMP87691.1 TraB/GumN family protein [Lacibacter sp.]